MNMSLDDRKNKFIACPHCNQVFLDEEMITTNEENDNDSDSESNAKCFCPICQQFIGTNDLRSIFQYYELDPCDPSSWPMSTDFKRCDTLGPFGITYKDGSITIIDALVVSAVLLAFLLIGIFVLEAV